MRDRPWISGVTDWDYECRLEALEREYRGNVCDARGES